jgi:hypothetical protein
MTIFFCLMTMGVVQLLLPKWLWPTAELLLATTSTMTLGSECHRTHDHILPYDSCGLVSCCWPLPAQWFLVPSRMGLMTIFYCLTALGTFWLCSGSHWIYSSGADWLKNIAISSYSCVLITCCGNVLKSHCVAVDTSMTLLWLQSSDIYMSRHNTRNRTHI